jgi:hyperosmotically inducible periplasmic protein
MTQRIFTMTAIGAIVASMALVGCNKQDQANAKTATSDAVSSVEQKSREVAQDAKDATKNAADKVGDKVADAMITTTVKAEIAKDSKLSALKINVDTDNGRVALRGTAPSNEAREHASTLAMAVKGVVSVDNQLSVEPGKS